MTTSKAVANSRGGSYGAALVNIRVQQCQRQCQRQRAPTGSDARKGREVARIPAPTSASARPSSALGAGGRRFESGRPDWLRASWSVPQVPLEGA